MRTALWPAVTAGLVKRLNRQLVAGTTLALPQPQTLYSLKAAACEFAQGGRYAEGCWRTTGGPWRYQFIALCGHGLKRICFDTGLPLVQRTLLFFPLKIVVSSSDSPLTRGGVAPPNPKLVERVLQPPATQAAASAPGPALTLYS